LAGGHPRDGDVPAVDQLRGVPARARESASDEFGVEPTAFGHRVESAPIPKKSALGRYPLPVLCPELSTGRPLRPAFRLFTPSQRTARAATAVEHTNEPPPRTSRNPEFHVTGNGARPRPASPEEGALTRIAGGAQVAPGRRHGQKDHQHRD